MPTITNSSDRVIKRPARGFHRFRDGTLNVTPKGGGEKELVKFNQESCLLSLPAEIRNQIWIYSIGKRTIRQSYRKVFVLEPSERPNPFALLRVCRQIYAETALHPIIHNVFQVSNCFQLRKATKAFCKYQLRQITGIRIELNSSNIKSGHNSYLEYMFDVSKLKVFPELRNVHVCVYPVNKWDDISYTDCSALIHKHYGLQTQAAGYSMVVEKMDIDRRKHIRHWAGLPPQEPN